jgi:hypothetical protein
MDSMQFMRAILTLVFLINTVLSYYAQRNEKVIYGNDRPLDYHFATSLVGTLLCGSLFLANLYQ